MDAARHQESPEALDDWAAGNGAGPGPADAFVAELLSRNVDLIDRQQQGTLMSMRVLVAGCGSVGGSVVEPLVRLGVGSLGLADPDRYELSNANRQLCLLSDVGRSKVDVVAARAAAINPLVEIARHPEGLTPENVEGALEGVTAVFDGIDSAPPSLWVKYLMHEHAARLGIPVVLGVDFGGKPTLYVWDYRRDRRPFYGKARREDFREGREIQALRAWMGVLPIPTDFFAVIRSRAESERPWPQVAYCATAMGALASRTLLDLARGEPTRHIVSADLDQLPRPPLARLANRARWPLEAVRTLRAVAKAREAAFAAGRATPAAPPAGPARAAVEAIRLAPTGHNTQPWRIEVAGDELRLATDPARALPAVDPERRYLAYALGTALASVERVAHASCELDRDPAAPSAQLVLTGLREREYLRAQGLLAARATNRAPFACDALDPTLLRRLAELARARGCELRVAEGAGEIAEAAALTHAGAAENLSSPAFLDELLSWLRLTAEEAAQRPDGFTAAALRLGPAVVPLVRLLRDRPGLRPRAVRLGLPRAMARDAARTLEASGALLLLTTPSPETQARVDGGRALLDVWLEATAARLAIQPVNFAVDNATTRPPLLALFGAPAEHEPVALLRIGVPTRAPATSPRRPLDEVCQIMQTVAA